ncbi:MAG: DUF192 domain-containing protein [Candidatus Micrarchaeota archaeon]|nr:DUF192 domain-containing protein [Candidatus Micrarchaeota archaeon]
MKRIKVKKYRILRNVKEKMKGLMFCKNVCSRLLFVFDEDVCYPFHSFFCPEFEILFLDRNMKINEFYFVDSPKIIKPKCKYRYVLETEPGFIKKMKIEKGDVVVLSR